MTPAALYALARTCRSLSSLTLPVDVPDDDIAVIERALGAQPCVEPQASLRYLSIGVAPLSLPSISALVRHVAAAFPTVEKIDSTAWGASCLEMNTPRADSTATILGPFPHSIPVGQGSYHFVTYSST